MKTGTAERLCEIEVKCECNKMVDFTDTFEPSCSISWWQGYLTRGEVQPKMLGFDRPHSKQGQCPVLPIMNKDLQSQNTEQIRTKIMPKNRPNTDQNLKNVHKHRPCGHKQNRCK